MPTHIRRSRILIAALAGAALAALGITAASSHAGRPTTSSTPPGKNGLLLFQKQIGSYTQLFTMAADGSGLRQITHGPHISEHAAWSPDGKTIAFSHHYATYVAIVLIRADGSGLRLLTPKGLQDTPAFGPDGRWIVYSRTLPKMDSLWVMDRTGRHQRHLTHNAPLRGQFPYDDGPVVSPDGKLVAFVRRLSDTRHALFVIGSDGRGQRQLTPWSFNAATKLDWAPDGSRILFNSVVGEVAKGVYTIRPDGSDRTKLFTSGEHDYCSDSFSPDGTQILLIDNCNSATDTNLYSMSADGGTPTPVPNSHGAHWISWGTAPAARSTQASRSMHFLTAGKGRNAELPKSTPQNTSFAPLTARTTYHASLVSPTPTITPPVSGWLGAQFVTHQNGKVRYETAALLWQDSSGREVDIVSGPAMTLSPAAALGWARRHTAHWDFSPYPPPGPVKRWAIAGRQALYFDATVPQPPGGTNGVWTLIGSNPPELQVDGDQSFRMTALSVRGKTVVIVIRAAHVDFAHFLPTAKRLVASLQFPPS